MFNYTHRQRALMPLISAATIFAACATAPTAPSAPEPPMDSVCLEAAGDAGCVFVTDAAGQVATSCDCEIDVEGKGHMLTVTGLDSEGNEISIRFEVEIEDGAWVLGDVVEP